MLLMRGFVERVFCNLHIAVWSARAASSLVSGEPKGPNVKTQIPGPKSKELMEELNQIQVKCKIYVKLFFLFWCFWAVFGKIFIKFYCIC